MTERLKRSRAGELPFQPVLIGLSFSDRQKLYARIEQRVDQMMERGLLEEAGRVLQDLGITASGAIGYKEFLPYFQGTASLEEAVEQLDLFSLSPASQEKRAEEEKKLVRERLSLIHI